MGRGIKRTACGPDPPTKLHHPAPCVGPGSEETHTGHGTCQTSSMGKAWDVPHIGTGNSMPCSADPRSARVGVHLMGVHHCATCTAHCGTHAAHSSCPSSSEICTSCSVGPRLAEGCAVCGVVPRVGAMCGTVQSGRHHTQHSTHSG